jgi:hypothetical protein
VAKKKSPKAQAGKLGGSATVQKYGKEYMRAIAAAGGRKRQENLRALVAQVDALESRLSQVPSQPEDQPAPLAERPVELTRQVAPGEPYIRRPRPPQALEPRWPPEKEAD